MDTPNEVAEVEVNSLSNNKRQFRVVILQKLYPSGIPLHAYGDALFRLEIAEQLHGAVIETEAELNARRRRPPIPSPSPAPKAEAPKTGSIDHEPDRGPPPVPSVPAAPNPDLFSRGAKQILEALQQAGAKGLDILGIQREVKSKMSRAYINQCLTELRQGLDPLNGPSIDVVKGSRPRRYRYLEIRGGMHEVPPAQPGMQ